MIPTIFVTSSIQLLLSYGHKRAPSRPKSHRVFVAPSRAAVGERLCADEWHAGGSWRLTGSWDSAYLDARHTFFDCGGRKNAVTRTLRSELLALLLGARTLLVFLRRPTEEQCLGFMRRHDVDITYYRGGLCCS